MDIRKLKEISRCIRRVLENEKSNTPDFALREFPVGACGVTAELICRYLVQFHNLDATYVEAEHRTREGSHAWSQIGDIIVDITADQFGQSPIIVTPESQWHQSEWKIINIRPEIMTEAGWPMYPHYSWHSILQELKEFTP